MKCPYCGFTESKVIDSRATEEGSVIRRRRECMKCQKRFTTYEKLETISLIVIKKDGSNQAYDRDKVIAGLVHACEKRPVSLNDMERLVDDIEIELYQSMIKEVTSTEIGEKVMVRLRKLDEVAYIRFASVYKRFDNIATFMEEINDLISVNRKIDLHTHSTASDGTLSPAELALKAHESGLSAVALTDHDTIDGVKEFISACEQYGVEPISGVEISAKYKCELHMVGLFVDYNNSEFKEKLDILKNSRFERNKKMLELLQKNGFDITEDDILGQKENATLANVGRAHIAHAMAAKGYVADVQEAFDKYLKKDMPCYVKRVTYSPEESIEIIHNAGGLAILAHPKFITEDRAELTTLLKRLKKAGLDGMECYYSEHSREFKNLCLDLCKEFDLLPSGGSDFHADNKPHIKIGKACSDMDIPYDLLEQMKKKKGII